MHPRQTGKSLCTFQASQFLGRGCRRLFIDASCMYTGWEKQSHLGTLRNLAACLGRVGCHDQIASLNEHTANCARRLINVGDTYNSPAKIAIRQGANIEGEVDTRAQKYNTFYILRLWGADFCHLWCATS